MKSRKTANNSLESTQAFRQSFLSSLSKLGNNATLKTGFDEIRELLMNHLKDGERLMIVLSSLSEIHQQLQKPSTRKEYIKVYGLIAEIYEDKILEIFPKIISSLNKRLKEGDNQLNQAISETMGQLVEHIFKHIDIQDALKPLSAALSLFFENFAHDQKNTQIGSAMCISKIIQTSPVDCLEYLMDKIVSKIKEALTNGCCKSQTQLLESLLSLILGVEEKFQIYLDEVLPIILDSMTNSDWNVRKIANDIIYTLCVLVPDRLTKFKSEITHHLNNCRLDKIKHVRDAASMAINIMKELRGSEWEEKNEENNMYLMDEDENLNENIERPDLHYLDHSGMIKNSFSKENILEKKLNSSKKLNSKKAGILNRPINPEFLKNAVKKSDGIEIKTNQPLLPISDNNSLQIQKNIYNLEKEKEENYFLNPQKFSPNKHSSRMSPSRNVLKISNDTEFVTKPIKASPGNINRSGLSNEPNKTYNNLHMQMNENSRNILPTNLNSKEYGEIMEKMNQIISQQNMLFEKYNFIENELKMQLKSTLSRVELLENTINNIKRPNNIYTQIPIEQRGVNPVYYLNYPPPYTQIPIQTTAPIMGPMSHIEPGMGMHLPKTNNFMSFGPSKINNERNNLLERAELNTNNYEFLSKSKNQNDNVGSENHNYQFINNKTHDNLQDSHYLNNQPMRLEEILHTNYQTFSPSKKIVSEGKNQNYSEINLDPINQKTPKKN